MDLTSADCRPSQRSDALNAIALIERFATIAGIGVFGNIVCLLFARLCGMQS
jgi:hypothetical protein